MISGVRFRLRAVQSRRAYSGPSPPKSPTCVLLHAPTSSAELTQVQLLVSSQAVTHLQNAAAMLAVMLGGCGAAGFLCPAIWDGCTKGSRGHTGAARRVCVCAAAAGRAGAHLPALCPPGGRWAQSHSAQEKPLCRARPLNSSVAENPAQQQELSFARTAALSRGGARLLRWRLGCSAGKQREADGNGCALCIHCCLPRPGELSPRAPQHPNLGSMSVLEGRQRFRQVPFVLLNMG